jgi:hypothetical protein
MGGNEMEEPVLKALEDAAADMRAPRRPRVLEVPPTPGGPVASAASAHRHGATHQQLKQVVGLHRSSAQDIQQRELARAGPAFDEAGSHSASNIASVPTTARSSHGTGSGDQQQEATMLLKSTASVEQGQHQAGITRDIGLTSDISERELESLLARYRVPSSHGDTDTHTHASHTDFAGKGPTNGTLWGYTGM